MLPIGPPADRFHLMKNLGETLDRFLQHKRAVIAQVSAPTTPSGAAPSSRGQPWQERQEEDSLRRHAPSIARYEQVIALHTKGVEIADIARTVGVSRTTVYRYLRLGGPPSRKQPRPLRRHHKVLDSYTAYLRQRWDEGCHTVTWLWREIQGMGYRSSYTNVMRFLAPLRLPLASARASIANEARATRHHRHGRWQCSSCSAPSD